MGQLVTASLQRSAFTKGISRIRHLVEFARMPSELWRQTSSDATRREESQPTVALLLLNSSHHRSRFPLMKALTILQDFPALSFSRGPNILHLVCNHLVFPWRFHLSRGALLDYHAPIGLPSSFPHPLPLPSLPLPRPPGCKTSNPSKSFWI